MKIINLKTEYKKNPIGIDITIPRLSWQIVSKEKNVMQNAYRIQVATSLDNLENGNFVWDSGKIFSDKSVCIEYAGQKLKSSQRYFWHVCVWIDENNHQRSEPAFWETALLDNDEWKAEWIHPLIEEDISKVCPCPLLRKEFNLGKKIKTAKVYVTSLGLYELEINGCRVGDAFFTPGWTTYKKRIQYQTYDVTNLLNEGNNAVGATLGDGWFRGHLAGWVEDNRNHYGEKLALIMQMNIEFDDGTTEIICTDDSWKSSTGPILASDIYNGETYDGRREKFGWSSVGFNDEKGGGVEILDRSKEILIAQVGPFVKKIQEIKPIEIIKTP